MRQSVRRSIAVLAGSTVLSIAGGVGVAGPAAADGDRPTNVAFVQAWQKVYIHQGGASLTVTAGLRCKPGWYSTELDMQVNQGDQGDSNYTIPDVPCDNKWHPVRFRIEGVTPAMHVGACTVSSQFLINNVDSGDSAGGHDVQRPCRIIRGQAPPVT
jgi:hypothetical protein